MLAALDSVKDNMDGSNYFEYCLFIPPKIEQEMRKQSSSVIIYRKKLVKHWLKYNPNASWECLAGRLLRRNQSQAVEKVKRNIFRPKKGINIFWCYGKQVAITRKRMCINHVKKFYCFSHYIQLIINC